LKAIKQEYLILKDLDNSSIIKVYDMYFNPIRSIISIVMEYTKGIELYDYIITKGPFDESKAKTLFKEIILAIAYIHDKGLCHRDLKPHNILLDENEKNIKIIDFNVSKYFKKTHKGVEVYYKMTTHTGTQAFSAPELLTHEEYE